MDSSSTQQNVCFTKDGLAYQFSKLTNSQGPRLVWVVYVNGLGLDQSFWKPSILGLQQKLQAFSSPRVYSTTFDRIGQGLSANKDGTRPVKHDLKYSVEELQQLLCHVQQTKLQGRRSESMKLIMVAHSIGVPLLRLFMAEYGSSWPIVGTVLIDSNMANVDMAELLPDSSKPDFDASTLPQDTDIAALNWSRDNARRMFSPSAPNKENLDRSTLSGLLPYPDQPVFPLQSNGEKIELKVIAHDPATFADESLKICTLGLTNTYVEPVWHRYNLGLLQLTGQRLKDSEIIVASGSGHFVQRDNPEVVAETVSCMIEKVIIH